MQQLQRRLWYEEEESRRLRAGGADTDAAAPLRAFMAEVRRVGVGLMKSEGPWQQAWGPNSLPHHTKQRKIPGLIYDVSEAKWRVQRLRLEIFSRTARLESVEHACAGLEKGRARMQPLVASLALALQAAKSIRAPPLW